MVLACSDHDQVGQGRADTVVTPKGRAGQGRAGQGRAGQDRIGISKTPNHAKNVSAAAISIDRQHKQYAHLVNKPTRPYTCDSGRRKHERQTWRHKKA